MSLLDFPEVAFPSGAVLREGAGSRLCAAWHFGVPGAEILGAAAGMGSARVQLPGGTSPEPCGGTVPLCRVALPAQPLPGPGGGSGPFAVLSPSLGEDFPECLQGMLIALASLGTAQPLGTKGS